jgi:hypothetical protein
MTMTPPPETYPEARACFTRVQFRLRCRGRWDDLFADGLWRVAVQCAHYMRFTRKIRALENVDSMPADGWAAALKDLEMGAEEMRRLARRSLAEFMMIHGERVGLSVMNAEGLDSEIAVLCSPLAPEEVTDLQARQKKKARPAMG